MKLILLGTGGYFPTSRRHTACMMLPEIGVVLDAGSGMCRIGQYLQTERLEVFLSHAHLDHILGLTYLINLVPNEVEFRTTVHCEASKLEAIREHLFAELIFPIAPRFRLEQIAQRCSIPEGGTLTHFPLEHPGGSLGFRLDWPDRSMAYVTDTTASVDADYVERIRGVDLLVHECYFVDDADNLPQITGHSCLPAVVEAAAAAQVGRVILVHINPQSTSDEVFGLTAARRTFKNVEIGMDEMTIEF